MTSTQIFQAGYATVDFTPAPGLPLLGQMHERIATGVRDPLEACAMAIHRDGKTFVLVTADVCMLSLQLIGEIQVEWQNRSGIASRHLLIQATHTHDAPAVTALMPTADCQPEFVAALREAILQSALQAVTNLKPVQVFSGTGHMQEMGWNRRAMFEDGTTQMYGHSKMEGFIGMEGPRDPALPVLFTRNEGGKLTGILVSFATHPNSIEAALEYSADVAGAVRRHLRKIFGEEIGVVYLTGAAGDTAPSILDPFDEAQPWRGDDGLERSGLYLAGEAAKVIASSVRPMADTTLQMEHTELSIPLRFWPQAGEPGCPPSDNNGPEYYREAENNWSEFRLNQSPAKVRINVLRIGDTAICTNPAELFVDFGLQIRDASPARVTFITQLTDGYAGYVPTQLAFERGGYETWCAFTSKLEFSAGDQIVATTRELLNAAF